VEHAPLRPVPTRAAGPIDPAAAARELATAHPDLSRVEAGALALVALGAVPRADAAIALGIDEPALAAVLATARKELRRTVTALPGSGWCERAERLISDRLDGPLTDTDARRLDAHLRNCPRCVEHERRLVQATDAWVATLAPRPAPVQPPPEPAEPLTEVPSRPPAEEPTTDEPAAPQPPVEEPPVDDPVQEPPVEEPPVEAPPVDAPAAGDVAAAAEVLVAARTRRQVAAAITWNALIILAVLLTLVTIGFTVAGILGAEL
jgi:Putative zinc-finger